MLDAHAEERPSSQHPYDVDTSSGGLGKTLWMESENAGKELQHPISKGHLSL